MNPRSFPEKMRRKMLAVDISEALNLTLQGTAGLTKVLLNQELSYVMLGACHSDSIVSEFG